MEQIKREMPYWVLAKTLHMDYFVKVWSKSHKKAKDERIKAILEEGLIADISEIIEIHASKEVVR